MVRPKHKIVSGLFELVVLGILRDRCLGGYDLICEVFERFGVLLSPGVVYPRLKSLENLGLIERTPAHNERKTLYKLTPKGECFLNEVVEEFERVVHLLTPICQNRKGYWHPNRG